MMITIRNRIAEWLSPPRSLALQWHHHHHVAVKVEVGRWALD